MKIQAPAGCEGVSLAGSYYLADARGVIDVPDGIPTDVLDKGYAPYVEPPAAASTYAE